MNKEKFIVYLVDDDADDLETLSEAFGDSGVVDKIKCFNSGIELLDLMERRKIELPDIIVLDHYLSIKDEVDMAGMIRKERNYGKITLAIYSSSLSPVKIEQLLIKGADICRSKGSSIHQLKLDVEAFCEAVRNKQKQWSE